MNKENNVQWRGGKRDLLRARHYIIKVYLI
jgi:hypothetical protein